MDTKFALSGKMGFAPAVTSILDSVDSATSSHEYYILRHPADIFHNVVSETIEKFLALLRLVLPLEQNSTAEPHVNDESLGLYKDLLASFSRYSDCTYEILLALTDKRPFVAEDRRFLWKWLGEEGFAAGKVYHSLTKTDAHFFREVNNELKHSSNRLRPVAVLVGSQLCNGYFVEAHRPDGTLGPSHLLHPGSNGKSAANSFNRDLRLLYHCTYLVADALSRAVTVHIKQVKKCALPTPSAGSYDDALCKDLFDAVVSLPQVYYPNEGGRVVPVPCIVLQNGQRFVEFKVLKAQRPLVPCVRVQVGTTIDRSRKFQAPFV